MVEYFLSGLTNNIDNSPVEDYFPDEHIFVISTHSPWYIDISNYLSARKLPCHLSPREQRKIVQQSTQYYWIEGYPFYSGPNQEIWSCVREDEVYDILKVCHRDPYGGHFVDKRIGYKALQMGYYWPTLFQDTKKYVQSYDSCQWMGQPIRSDDILLQEGYLTL
jgi:hypothetical protein